MIVYDLKQLSPEWHEVRGKMPTASNFRRIISSKGAISAQFDKYVAEVRGETEKRTIQTASMKDGINYEHYAISAVQRKYDLIIEDVGFISDDKKIAGCSPDGVVNDVLFGLIAGVEVKTVKPNIFEKYEKAGKLPTEYYPQVMGSMAITGVDKWYFGATDVDAYKDGYNPKKERLFSLEVDRDEEWIERFWQILNVFNKEVKK